MKKNLYLTISLVVIICAGAMIWFWRVAEKENEFSESAPVIDLEHARQEQAEHARQDFISGKKKTFTHSTLNFIFEYPEGYTIGNFPEGEDGEVVLLQKDNVGFQLFIRPFDEDIALTPQRIRQDVSDIVMKNELIISVGGAQGVVFTSEEQGNVTSEIWFVNSGRLYQITTYPEFDRIMADILETWRWEG